jgi:hypothetical protein
MAFERAWPAAISSELRLKWPFRVDPVSQGL